MMLCGDMRPGDMVLWRNRDRLTEAEDSLDLLLSVEPHTDKRYPDWLVFTWLSAGSGMWRNTNLPWKTGLFSELYRRGERIA